MTTTVRDYVAEMNKVLDEVTGDGDWIPSVVADRVADFLEDEDPELLTGWLRSMQVMIIADHLRLRERSARSVARSRSGARAFSEAVSVSDVTGDTGALRGVFTVTYEVGPDHTRRALGEMTGADHLFVADHYGQAARKNAFLEVVHRKVAGEVGDRRTSEVYTPEQWSKMFGTTED